MSLSVESRLVGSKVHIKTQDGEYEGVVKSVIGEMSKISLFNVIVFPDKTQLLGLQTFFGREILSCTMIEAKHEIQKNKTLPAKKIVLAPIPFGQLETNDQNFDNIPVEINNPEYRKVVFKKGALWLNIGEEEIPESLDLDLDKPKIDFKLPENYQIIDTLEDEFHSAIKDIKRHAIIGVSIEGANMGRRGEVCLLNIATNDTVYFFDIMELGKNAFASGLKSVLEDVSITKVFHDCRLPSDILFHKYSVNLRNISDTLVLDIMVARYMSRNRQLPDFIRNLSLLLKELLDLEDECIEFNQYQINRTLVDVMSWQIRPMPISHRVCAVSHVIYLCVLQKALMDKYLRDITRGTDIFLGLVRDTHNDQFALQLANSLAMPPSIGALFGQNIKYIHNLNRPKQNDCRLDLFSRAKLLEGTDASTEEVAEFCMQGLNISDFLENPKKHKDSKQSNKEVLSNSDTESRETNNSSPDIMKSTNKISTSCDTDNDIDYARDVSSEKTNGRNVASKKNNFKFIPAGMEQNT